ncbi:MAG: acyl dehydratase [Pseudomonadota bacterium]
MTEQAETSAIGRRAYLRDPMAPERALALHMLLGRDGPKPVHGAQLRPFDHQVYFWRLFSPEDQGTDGHERIGRFLPDFGLDQRMWAGGVYSFTHALTLGQTAEKTSEITGVTRKEGRSGPLGFVTVAHSYRQNGHVMGHERQELVYRTGAPRKTPPPDAPVDEDEATTHCHTAVDLFRYSALTYNGHRIHYDGDYCRDVLGLLGPVVHGPLLAQRLIDIAARKLPEFRQFSFRAISPLFVDEPAAFCWRGDQALWVRGSDGRLCMSATAA